LDHPNNVFGAECKLKCSLFVLSFALLLRSIYFPHFISYSAILSVRVLPLQWNTDFHANIRRQKYSFVGLCQKIRDCELIVDLIWISFLMWFSFGTSVSKECYLNFAILCWRFSLLAIFMVWFVMHSPHDIWRDTCLSAKTNMKRFKLNVCNETNVFLTYG
jgi:hypothetical protein